MSVERAAAIESIHRRRLRKSATASGGQLQLRIAEHPVRDRVQRMVDLAFSLLGETESLARDKAFTEASTTLRRLNVAEGVDFYQEVQQFEIELIRLALDHTRGSQVKAAKLLAIKPTTLNSKIKLYGIEY
jgi:DNA-binding protein Fis